MHITSAAGVIALLDEPEDELKVYALKRLNDIVPEFWPEISDHVEKIEVLYENESFKHREMSALLASKLYYYLGSYEDSLHYALCAGSTFNVKESSEYVVTTICKCIDHYTKLRQLHDAKADGDMPPEIDRRLEEVVNRMFENCLEAGQFKQAIGIAIETRRMDILEKAIKLTPNLSEILAYCTNLCTRLLQNKGLREKILRLLVRLHSNLNTDSSAPTAQPDYINICQCLIYLDDPVSVSEILTKLIKEEKDQVSLAYQIGFDLYDSASQNFLSQVVQALKTAASPIGSSLNSSKLSASTEESMGDATVTATSGNAISLSSTTSKSSRFVSKTAGSRIPADTSSSKGPTDYSTSKMVTDYSASKGPTDFSMTSKAVTDYSTSKAQSEFATSKAVTDFNSSKATSELPSDAFSGASRASTKATSNITLNSAATATTAVNIPSTVVSVTEEVESPFDAEVRKRLDCLAAILDGQKTIELYLQFLIRNNHSDLLTLKSTKDQVRNSVCHNACVIANSFMHCGTTIDQFLRDNLDWLSRATNWAKFSATASLGVIHKGHESDSLSLMSTYLPKDSSGGSAYQEGGGLFALGLIHANHGRGQIMEYLHDQLNEATNEIIRHGGCLGLGLAAMGTADQTMYDLLKNNLYQDDAVTGEAAGIAMGLVMIGSNSEQALRDMVSYAQETQHEKIIRGLAIGIALVMYGRMEEADALIDNLMRDKDPILRRCAMYTIAMAYVGSGSNKANRKLLHVAVSDVNNDVRRAAVESLGFILFRTPEQCPSVVSLLSESYNPHVRYGSAMALGISCSGTGNKDALSLLEPLTSDSVNYVRQGALLASAMITIQHTEATCPKVKTFKELYRKVISDKHEDVMAKFGAILAQGIIDAGGRNVTLSLQSRMGHVNMASVAGMLVFCQFWFWFPLSHFLSLAFTPSAIIALNAELKMPKIEFRSNAKPSTYAYPAPLEEKKGRETEKVETAVLSTTAKAKAKEIKKEKRKASTSAAKASSAEEKMEVDENEKKVELKVSARGTESMETNQVGDIKEKTEKKEAKDKKEAKEEEPLFEMIKNPSRAILPQLKVIAIPDDSRYSPLKPLSRGGIVLMKDRKSDEPEELLEPVIAGGPKKEDADDENEPEPPEPFEYIE